MKEYIKGKWKRLYGCRECNLYGEAWDIDSVCAKCGEETEGVTARSIIEKKEWYKFNKFIGYETLEQFNELKD